MQSLQPRLYEPPALSAHSIVLRQRVEELEHLREVACLKRNREAVDTIDAQIKIAVCEWIDSLVDGLKRELGDQMEPAVETKAA
jgi:hypothetical protein